MQPTVMLRGKSIVIKARRWHQSELATSFFAQCAHARFQAQLANGMPLPVLIVLLRTNEMCHHPPRRGAAGPLAQLRQENFRSEAARIPLAIEGDQGTARTIIRLQGCCRAMRDDAARAGFLSLITTKQPDQESIDSDCRTWRSRSIRLRRLGFLQPDQHDSRMCARLEYSYIGEIEVLSHQQRWSRHDAMKTTASSEPASDSAGTVSTSCPYRAMKLYQLRRQVLVEFDLHAIAGSSGSGNWSWHGRRRLKGDERLSLDPA